MEDGRRPAVPWIRQSTIINGVTHDDWILEGAQLVRTTHRPVLIVSLLALALLSYVVSPPLLWVWTLIHPNYDNNNDDDDDNNGTTTSRRATAFLTNWMGDTVPRITASLLMLYVGICLAYLVFDQVWMMSNDETLTPCPPKAPTKKKT